VVMHVLAADFAIIDDFEECAKQMPLAAVWAAAVETALDGRRKITGRAFAAHH